MLKQVLVRDRDSDTHVLQVVNRREWMETDEGHTDKKHLTPRERQKHRRSRHGKAADTSSPNLISMTQNCEEGKAWVEQKKKASG